MGAGGSDRRGASTSSSRSRPWSGPRWSGDVRCVVVDVVGAEVLRGACGLRARGSLLVGCCGSRTPAPRWLPLRRRPPGRASGVPLVLDPPVPKGGLSRVAGFHRREPACRHQCVAIGRVVIGRVVGRGPSPRPARRHPGRCHGSGVGSRRRSGGDHPFVRGRPPGRPRPGQTVDLDRMHQDRSDFRWTSNVSRIATTSDSSHGPRFSSAQKVMLWWFSNGSVLAPPEESAGSGAIPVELRWSAPAGLLARTTRWRRRAPCRPNPTM